MCSERRRDWKNHDADALRSVPRPRERRDSTSVRGIRAEHDDVLVDAPAAEEALMLLGVSFRRSVATTTP